MGEKIPAGKAVRDSNFDNSQRFYESQKGEGNECRRKACRILLLGVLMYSKEVAVPEGVTVEITNVKFKVSGPKGSVEKNFELTKQIKAEKVENKIKISSENERRNTKALIGTNIGHIKNAIDGVTKGFTYRLRVVYSHFPVTVKAEKEKVVISNFLGERTNRIAKIVGQSQVKIEGADIVVTGINIEEVGQTAGNLELATRIVGFDKKIFQDGIYLVSRGEEK